MKFSIIIPAYNEQESIEAIILKCISAKDEIIKKVGIDDVEIIVVSDGSTDNTSKIAERFVSEIKLISYPDNRGYGIAIKTGFECSSGDVVSFLDADGTCDPLYFADMLIKLEQEKADICIGSRMGPDSQMPRIRRIGNVIFKSIINLIAGTDITDAASGMRVIRKEKLKMLYPLPDGLSFTPGMTCRAVLDPELKIIEINISYKEREGKSKLDVCIEGFNFFKVIISIALTYKPLKILGSFGFLVMLISFLFCVVPLISFLKNDYILGDQIYSLFFVMLFGTSGMILLGLASVAERAVRLFNRIEENKSFTGYIIGWFFSWNRQWFIAPLLMLAGIVPNAKALIKWMMTGEIYQNFLSIMAGGYLVLLGIVCFAFGATDYLIVLSHQKKCYDDTHKGK